MFFNQSAVFLPCLPEEKWGTTRSLQPTFIKIKFHRLVASQRAVVGGGGGGWGVVGMDASFLALAKSIYYSNPLSLCK